VQKDTDDLTVFFTLLGSIGVKAALKTLMKLTRGRLVVKQQFLESHLQVENEEEEINNWASHH